MTVRFESFGTATTPLQAVVVCIGDDGKYETFQGRERLKWNNYSVQRIRITRSPGQEPSHVGDQWMDGSLFHPTDFPNANDILRLQSSLSEAVKGHDFNLAVFAAQGNQTVSMAVNALTSIGGAISDLKRGRFENAARRFGVSPRPSKLSHRDISGRWLELQYGWLPLLSDVHEASKAYESLTSPPRISRRSVSLTSVSEMDCSNNPSLYHCKGPLKESVRLIYEATEELSVPRTLGLTDPLSVAWELIPYSFVADWFIPIGSYLENLNTIPSLSGRFLTTITRRSQCNFSANSASGVTWSIEPRVNSSFFYMERVISTSLAVPKPVFVKLPSALSPSRIYNAIALVAQKFR